MKRSERHDRHKRQKRYLQEQNLPVDYRYRRWFLMGVFALASVSLVVSAVGRQVFETDFLQNEGKRRHLSVVKMPAYRGMIQDRRGEILAVSTPADSVWMNPRAMPSDVRSLQPLAKVLDMDVEDLRSLQARYNKRAFVYVKRRVRPDVAEKVLQLSKEQGVNTFGLQREYRRYYPSGEIFSHIIGFTNIDDQGQEGLELVFNEALEGEHGRKYVIRDGKRRVVNDIEQIAPPRAGETIKLSLDARLQFLAYRELKKIKLKHKAKSASAVVLDVKTGEILAMVNQPGYNPNGNRSNKNGRLRNRAVTDAFEPGSTMKPFIVAAGLESGVVNKLSKINTAPGYFSIGRDIVRDHNNIGLIDLETLLRKSSNVGASKISLEMAPEELYAFVSNLGFGSGVALGFPGETGGYVNNYNRWAKIDQATLSFGYGISVNTLQLAQAYAVLGNGGVYRQATFFKDDNTTTERRVMTEETAEAVLNMLESVVSTDGTAPLAAVPGYRMAGKTGTVKKYSAEGYADDRYRSVFAGVGPVDNPRLAMAIVVDEPAAGKFYGGDVAAPVFSEVMAGGMRLLNIAPDEQVDGMQIAAGQITASQIVAGGLQ